MKSKMPDLDALPERVDVIERKLDALSASVDRRFDEVDKRFDEVQQQFVEQRMYTEFAFERVERSLARLDERMERSLARLDRKLDQVIDAQRAPSPRRPPKRPRKLKDT